MCRLTDATNALPERELSRLIESEIGIAIDQHALRMFIRANWPRVAALAHAIHGEPTRPEVQRGVY